jgi:hypothetical protein
MILPISASQVARREPRVPGNDSVIETIRPEGVEDEKIASHTHPIPTRSKVPKELSR